MYDIKNIKINRELFDKVNIDPGGVVLTAKGHNSDFVSRFFTPQSTYFEDPVTGSSHCSLIPYWSGVLNKNEMISHQLSERKGEVFCKNLENRVATSPTIAITPYIAPNVNAPESPGKILLGIL